MAVVAKCDMCIHSRVCKYKGDCTSVTSAINNLIKEPTSKVVLTLGCEFFKLSGFSGLVGYGGGGGKG